MGMEGWKDDRSEEEEEFEEEEEEEEEEQRMFQRFETKDDSLTKRGLALGLMKPC